MVEKLGAEAPLAGVRTVLQTAATGYIYDPDITTVVYGFNGRPWPTFMVAVDDCKPTPSFTATTALLLNQLSRPVKATACEIDVNESFLPETLQLLQSWESSWNRDLKLVTKSIMIKEVRRTSRGGVGTAVSSDNRWPHKDGKYEVVCLQDRKKKRSCTIHHCDQQPCYWWRGGCNHRGGGLQDS